MSSEQERKDPEKRKELDEKARRGEVVVPSGTGGKSVEAQEHLAAGRRKGGLSTKDKSGEERAKEEGIDLIPDDSKSKSKTKTKTKGRQ